MTLSRNDCRHPQRSLLESWDRDPVSRLRRRFLYCRKCETRAVPWGPANDTPEVLQEIESLYTTDPNIPAGE